jgi:hypothetical protein
VTCTTGMWVWPRPLPLPPPSSADVVLVDLQGLDVGDDAVNCQLAAAGLLMSSFLVFNVNGYLNSGHAAMLNVVRGVAAAAAGTPENRRDFFPADCLVRSRDLELGDLAADFPGIAGADALLALPAATLDAQFKATLRTVRVDADLAQAHDALFLSDRTFARVGWQPTLPPTGAEEREMDRTMRAPTGTSPFARSMDALVGRILAGARPKRIGGATIDMRVFFAQMARMSAEMGGRALVLPRLQDRMHLEQAEAAATRAHRDFSGAFEAKAFSEEAALRARYTALEALALAAYDAEVAARGLQAAQARVARGGLAVRLRERYAAELEAYREQLSVRAEAGLGRIAAQETEQARLAGVVDQALAAARALAPEIAAVRASIREAHRALEDERRKQDAAAAESNARHDEYARDRRKKDDPCVIL